MYRSQLVGVALLGDVIPLLVLVGHQRRDCLLVKGDCGEPHNWILIYLGIGIVTIPVHLVEEEGGNMGISDENDMLLREGDVVKRRVGMVQAWVGHLVTSITLP